MDLRENLYYLVLFAFLLFSLIAVLYLMGRDIYNLHKSYVLTSQLSEFVYEGSSIYYLGSYAYFENNLFEKHSCFSQYEGDLSQKIVCDGRDLPYYRISFPLLLDLTGKNKYIMVERGHIAYGPYNYLYLLITNKKIVLFEINHGNEQLIRNGFDNILKSVPTNYVIGFCANDKAILWVDTSKKISKSDKNDFMKEYVITNDLKKMLQEKGLNNPFGSVSCKNALESFNNRYYKFPVILIKIVDNENKCYNNKDCLIITPSLKKWKYGGLSKNIYETYDLTLLLFFKNYYGLLSQNGDYMLIEENYRKMWQETLAYYLPVVANRYKYLADHKQFDEPYQECTNYFTQLYSALCSNNANSLCRMLYTRSLDNILQKMEEIKNIYETEVLKGCEEEIYM